MNALASMPDAFFVSNKTRKRKRSGSAADASGQSKKFAGKKGREPSSSSKQPTKKAKRNDEELDSDRTDDEGNIDDLDLRQSDGEEGSADEDENETPAEKRLRLAKLYLESVKEGLGACHALSPSNFLTSCSRGRV